MAYITILIMGAIFSLSGILFPAAVCRIFIKMNPTLTSYYLQAILRSAQSLCISLLRNIILNSFGYIMEVAH